VRSGDGCPSLFLVLTPLLRFPLLLRSPLDFLLSSSLPASSPLYFLSSVACVLSELTRCMMPSRKFI
jgi:hypothetical protein